MFKNLKLKTKLLLFFPVLFLLSFAVVGAVAFINFSRLSDDNILKSDFESVEVRRQQIETFLTDRKGDILLISQLDSLQRLINDSEEEARIITQRSLQQDFLALAKSRQIYDQIRYLDETGQEIVRVDTEGNNSYVVASPQLQNKKDRYYFTDTIKLQSGQLFVSSLDLNIENGEIEIPYQPMLRYSTPVFDNSGTLRGLVIINVQAGYFLKKIHTENQGSLHLLINQDGYYLYHPQPDKTWGFMLETDEGVFKDFPHLADQIISQGKGFLFDEQTQNYVSFATLNLNNIYNKTNILSDNSDDYWIVISLKSKADIIDNYITSTLYEFIAIIIIVFIIVIVIVLTIVRSITKRFNSLQKGIKIIKQGNFDYRLVVDRHDELGEISRDFNDMSIAIQESRSGIDKKVHQQTKDIKQKQKTLEQQQKAVLNVLEDVEDERDKVSIERDKVDAILQSIGDGVFVVDIDLKIIMANQVTADISGYTKEELKGQKYSKFLKFVFEKDNKINDKFVKGAIATGKIKEMANHTLLINRDGDKIPVADSAAPLKDKNGNVIGCVVVFRDVSEERAVDRMKTEFVSLASHQLRTPLTAMRWSIEEIVGGELGKDDSKEYLHDTLEAVIRLSRLVNSLLNISRLETGRININPQPTDLVDLVGDVLKTHAEAAKRQGVALRFNKPKTDLKKIKIDPTLVREVLANLIDNAIKYSRVDKEKRIVKVKMYREGEDIITCVMDNGIGIPKKQQPRIFEKFFRADNASKRQAEGNGLGLYVIFMISKASGGKLWFKSSKEGTSFYFSLPLAGSKKFKGEKGLAGHENK